MSMKSKRLSRFVLPCLLVLFGSVLSVSVESAETASVVTHGPLLGASSIKLIYSTTKTYTLRKKSEKSIEWPFLILFH